ncbi:MAG: response regulator [Oscillospiraceae bacterium]|jgi:putative two-component system response regulator|nr:response regulator [Oscillospiraceae bacterium]
MDSTDKKIFIVDDSITNLSIAKNILIDKYDVFTIPSGQKLFSLLEKVKPDLILLDIEMPGMNGYDVIRKLKADPETRGLPVMFLSAKSDTGSELEGLSLGAIDYISKPFSPTLLQKRIEVHLLVETQKAELAGYNKNLRQMVEEKTKTVYELQNSILRTVAELVECRDDITGGHIERTQSFLEILVNEIVKRGLFPEEKDLWDNEFFLQSAQLHDVGKIATKDSILMKPGKLTSEEYEEMKKHTLFGVSTIEQIEHGTSEHEFLKHAKIFAGSHHEKWDGSGYPHGLKGDEIPLQGRLMAIADVYDALISERPYKKAFTHEEARGIIIDGSGKHFDPVLVRLFASVSDEFERVAKQTM